MKVLVQNELKHYLTTMLSVAVILLKFNGKSKLTTWRHFNSSSDAVLDAFSQLGSPDLSILDETTATLQTYIMNQAYYEKRPSSNKTIGELRWYMFTKRQLKSEKPLPTESAIRKKVVRSHYVANIWIQAEKSHMDYLNPIVGRGQTIGS